MDFMTMLTSLWLNLTSHPAASGMLFPLFFILVHDSVVCCYARYATALSRSKISNTLDIEVSREHVNSQKFMLLCPSLKSATYTLFYLKVLTQTKINHLFKRPFPCLTTHLTPPLTNLSASSKPPSLTTATPATNPKTPTVKIVFLTTFHPPTLKLFRCFFASTYSKSAPGMKMLRSQNMN